jgi:biopolymer transport protein ExbD
MRKKRHRVHAESAMGNEFSSTSVFVTPMLDMAFQILAFFVFTYSPTAIEGQFPIALAQGETGGEKPNQKPDERVATEEVTELKPTLFVEVRAKEKGKLGNIRIRTPAGVTPVPAPGGVSDEEERTQGLLMALRDKLVELKAQNPTEDRITIEGTPSLHWNEMMKVVDVCRRTVDARTKQRRELFPRVNLGYINQ